MSNELQKPIVIAFAGPNGSGKTTVNQSLPVFGTYVNADDLKKEYNLTDLEAAQQAELLRNTLLNNRKNFSFETVLSTERNLLLLKKAKELGYEVHCVYVLTCNENINVARVRMRVASGGHAVPEDKIRIRFHRALAILSELVDVCERIMVYDNSVHPDLIFSKEDLCFKFFPNRFWSEEALRKLIK